MAPARTGEDVDRITLVSRDPRLDLRRNLFPPVSRLPADILVHIFIHNARDSYVDETYSHSSPATPSWVNVSYVCRYWRDVALNCQTLWTYIPTTSQRWTLELLARSQKAPLRICIRLDLEVGGVDRLASHVLSIVEQLMNHSQRIQELHFDFVESTEEYDYQILSKFLSSCLPCLQHLQISNFYSSEALLPFKGNTPALHTLMLEDSYMPWNSLELNALTTLHLNSAELPFHEYKMMVEFLTMLRRMPHLVKLYIHDSLHGAYDSLPSVEFAAPMINLSRLSIMSIGAPLSILNTLLPCVDIPLTTRVTLGCMGCGSTPDDDFTRLASLLAQRINPTYDPTPAVPKFRSLTIGINPMATLAFSTSERGCSSPSSVLSDENTRLQVYFTDDVVFARPCATLSHMCRSIPFTDIGSVHFTQLTGLLDFWRDMLVSFPNVRHIKLSGSYDHMPNIASMLSLPSHDCSGDRDDCIDGYQNEIFVPALEELELYNITFSRKDSGSDLDALCQAISTRKETQCRLAIKECCEITNSVEALNLVGWWEGTRFKVTHDFSKRLILH